MSVAPEQFGFNPDEPRAPDGKWTSEGGGIIAYHGTTQKLASKIKSEGIKISGESKRTYKTSSGDSGDLYSGDRGQAVFVANSFRVAADYAEEKLMINAASGKGRGRGAVLVLKIPKDHWREFKKDEKHGTTGSAYRTKNIPASWIKSAYSLENYSGTRHRVKIFSGEAMINTDNTTRLDDGNSVFIVLMVDGETGNEGQTITHTSETIGVNRLMAEQFARIDSAEIFAEGTWNGLKFSQDDLDSIVKAFDVLSLAGRVPLKLGHTGPDTRDDPTSQLAMGWVDRIWRDGKKLMATLDVPEKVHSLIQQGFLKFVSVELLRDVKASTRVIPWVLDAVALLGSDQPAVGVLKDLQALTMARTAPSLEYGGRATFARADYVPFKSTGVHRKMADREDEGRTALQELTDKVLQMSNQLNDVQSENRQLKNQLTEAAQIKGRFERLSAEVQQSNVSAHRSKIKDRIDAAVKAQDILPAARERFAKVYKIEDDNVVLGVSMEDVEEFIKENPNSKKPREQRKVHNAVAKFTDELSGELKPDEEALVRVQAWFREQGIKSPTHLDYVAGAKAVFTALPDFGQRYKAAADAAYDG
jgi:hypothetical protein